MLTLNEQIQLAQESEAKGIPVDWRAMTMMVYNVADQEFKRLNIELEALKSESTHAKVTDPAKIAEIFAHEDLSEPSGDSAA